MKKVFITVACIAAIIAVRMILSVTLSEQVADVFTRVSVGSLFFYFCITCTKSRHNAKKQYTVSGKL